MHGYRDYVAARCCGIALITLLLARTAGAYPLAPGAVTPTAAAPASQPPATTALGAHLLLTQPNGLGVSPAVSTAVATQPSGSALLLLVGGYASNDAAPTDSYANRWQRIGKSVVYRGYGGSFDVTAYAAMAARGGARQQISVMKSAQPNGEVSVPFVEIRHAARLQDLAQNYPSPGLVVTSGSVTTTAPATLLAFWWGDAGVKRMTATPNNGFAVIDRFLKLPDSSGVQCAVAFREVSAAGTYNVSWTSAPVQGAILWLFAFQSG